MKASIKPSDVVKLLNELMVLDPQAMHAMANMRTICNAKIGNHPTVQVAQHKNKIDIEVGLLGIINGTFGPIHRGKHKGRGPVAAMFNDRTGRLQGFVLTQSLPA